MEIVVTDTGVGIPVEAMHGEFGAGCQEIIVAGGGEPVAIDPAPSPDDIVMTKHVLDAGKVFDIELLDQSGRRSAG